MKKKLFSLIMSAIMVVGMTACGSGGGEAGIFRLDFDTGMCCLVGFDGL